MKKHHHKLKIHKGSKKQKHGKRHHGHHGGHHSKKGHHGLVERSPGDRAAKPSYNVEYRQDTGEYSSGSVPVDQDSWNRQTVGLKMTVDSSRCRLCGKCARICPNHAIRVTEDACLINIDACDGCGECAQRCKQGALTLGNRSDAVA